MNETNIFWGKSPIILENAIIFKIYSDKIREVHGHNLKE